LKNESPTSSIIGIVSEKPGLENIAAFTQPKAMPMINLKTMNVKRVLAIIFALVSGFFYGEDVTPVIMAQDRYKNAPQDGLSYCFAHYMGVFLTASLVFCVYCGVK
jgi:hypothetical protein